MAIADSTARKQVAEPAPSFRSAPHNIEAEQALLGAILVNNEAFYRVSDFLEPAHFFEPIYQQIYQLARDLIRAGKLATPVTLKTFLDADVDIGGLTVSQYLARLAAEATTIINAEDYGRTVYDLSVRRALIQVGEDMVNVAFDAPVDFSPRDQIEDAERRLYELAETGRYDGGFQRFAQALTTAIDMAAHAFQRDGKLSGTATGLHDLDRMMGGLQQSDLVILAGRPGMGKTALATNIAYNIAKAWVRWPATPGRSTSTVNGGIVGFFSLEMSAEQLATRIIAEQTGIPSSQIRRGGISESDFEKIKDYSIELAEYSALCGRDWRPVSCAACGSRDDGSSGSAVSICWSSTICSFCKARPGARRKTASRKSLKSRPSSKHWRKNLIFQFLRCHSYRARWKVAMTNGLNSRICENPAQSNKTPTWFCSSIREEYYHHDAKAAGIQSRKILGVAGRSATKCMARPKSSSANSVMGRQALSNCSSTQQVTRFSSLAREARLPERM